MEEDRLVKVVISGDSGVGKSSLLLRFSNNHFNPFQEPTIVHFEQKIIEVEGKVIKVLFWDTSGLKSFQSLNYLLYKQAMGIILVYSVGDKETFNNITNLINCINQHSSQDISLLLIGNKIDESNRQVTYEEGERLAKNLGIPFFEISAQDGTNVADIFYAMAKLLKSQLEKEEINFQFELQKNEQNSQLNQFQEEIQIEESEQEQVVQNSSSLQLLVIRVWARQIFCPDFIKILCKTSILKQLKKILIVLQPKQRTQQLNFKFGNLMIKIQLIFKPIIQETMDSFQFIL